MVRKTVLAVAGLFIIVNYQTTFSIKIPKVVFLNLL